MTAGLQPAERLAGVGRRVVLATHRRSGTHLTLDLLRRHFPACRARKWPFQGLDSLYLNLEGREGQGCVAATEHGPLLDELKAELLGWQGPDGRAVINQVWSREEAFAGPLAEYGPDMVVGYSTGYRASSQTGLGTWEQEILEPNSDRWGGDHCMDPSLVPGVLFCNQGLGDFPTPSYYDFPTLAIGAPLDAGASSPPPTLSDEDSEIVEERLRGLGYL